MKSTHSMFFILLFAVISVVICNCNDTSKNTNSFSAKSLRSTKLETAVLTVKGVVCHSCIRSITRNLVERGVISAEVTLEETNNVKVTFDAKDITLDEIKAVIRNGGNEIID